MRDAPALVHWGNSPRSIRYQKIRASLFQALEAQRGLMSVEMQRERRLVLQPAKSASAAFEMNRHAPIKVRPFPAVASAFGEL